MSDNDQPQQPPQPGWDGQLYGNQGGQQYSAPGHQAGPPAQQAPPPQASNLNVGTPANMGAMIRDAPPKPTRGYHRFVLPASVKNSTHWHGTDADLIFGLWEPDAGEIRKMTKADTEWSDAAKNYVAMIGDVHVTDNTSQVLPWAARISPKALTLVTSQFVEMIMPTADEGESLRASKQWVGG